MATLHRFKLLATQCATAAGRGVSPGTSPSASPCSQQFRPHHHATSPSIGTPSKSPSFNLRHHRRRRTLRRLLSGSLSSSTSSSSSTRSIFTRVTKGRNSTSSSSMDLTAAPAPERDAGGKRGLLSHRSLKDLFVSSPSPPPSSSSSTRANSQNQRRGGGDGGEPDDAGVAVVADWRRIRSPVRGRGGGWSLTSSSRRFGGSGGSLRYRLLRRAWRPVLVTIPE